MALEAVPLELKQANEFVSKLHRHHDAVYRDKFRIGALLNGELVGVVQLGRPVSRELDNGKSIEEIIEDYSYDSRVVVVEPQSGKMWCQGKPYVKEEKK